MAPVESLSTLSASKLPFNPFVPRTSWVIEKSVLSEALTPAMIKAFSSIGVAFTRRPQLTQTSALSDKKTLSVLQPKEQVAVVSLPNFSIIVRALPAEKLFELNPLVAQELARSKNTSLVPAKSTLPVITLSCIDRGNDLLLTMNVAQAAVVMGATRVQTEMSVTQASWLRVTKPMMLFSLLDRLYRASLMSIDPKPVSSNLSYEVSVIVDRGLLCGVEKQTQTRKKLSWSESTQTNVPKSTKQIQTRNRVPRKPAQIKSNDRCYVLLDTMQYVFLALFFIMLGLVDYHPYLVHNVTHG